MFESWPGEKLLMKIWKTLIDNGCSAAFRPYQIKREAKARADSRRQEMLMLAQAEKDVEKIKSGRAVLSDDGLLLATDESLEEQARVPTLTQNVEESTPTLMRLRHARTRDNYVLELRKAINLRKAVSFAEEEADYILDGPVADDSVDPDWFSKWRTGVQEVSKEEVQRVWGRMLAGEIRQPGSFSRRSIQLLSQFSHKDAELVSKIANYNMGGWILKPKDSYYQTAGLSFADFIYLEDLGVLNGVFALGGAQRNFEASEWNGKKLVMIGLPSCKLVVTSADISQIKLSIPVYNISAPALELMSLTSQQIPIEYLRQIAAVAQSSGFVPLGYGVAIVSGSQLVMELDQLLSLDVG